MVFETFVCVASNSDPNALFPGPPGLSSLLGKTCLGMPARVLCVCFAGIVDAFDLRYFSGRSLDDALAASVDGETFLFVVTCES